MSMVIDIVSKDGSIFSNDNFYVCVFINYAINPTDHIDLEFFQLCVNTILALLVFGREPYEFV